MRIHFIAIGGAVMHQLAIDLKKQGHQVTGSDDEIFDPAKSNLAKHQILPQKTGWDSSSITEDIDAIVLGMHAHSDNPEIQKAQELKLKIYSFPEFVYEQTKNNLRVSVSGSHGKTSTTAMIMHVLKLAKIDFDYLVGSKLDDFENSVSIKGAPILISEGDEYPASALNKIPKFLFLKPQISILTGIAWDHINVFPTYENYFEQFEKFLLSMPDGGKLIYNSEDPEVVRCVEKNGLHLEKISYTPLKSIIKHGTTFLIDQNNQEYQLKIFGAHNLSNLAAAKIVLHELGISELNFYTHIQSFGGTAKRMEIINSNSNGYVFRDFAHAPSKLKATLQAAKKQFEGYKLVACFELHTYSSLNVNFMHDYAQSMNEADAAVVFYSEHALEMKRLPFFSKEVVIDKFQNKKLKVYTNRSEIEDFLTKTKDTTTPTVYLMMSSGTFDNMTLDYMKSLIQ